MMNNNKFLNMFFNKEFVLFVIMGCINTFSGVVLSYVYSMLLNPNLSFMIGYASGLVISYMLNSLFTFKEKLGIQKFIRYVVSYIPNFIIQNICVYIVFNVMNYDKLIAYLIAAVIGIPVTFIMTKLFAFKQKI